MGRFWATFMSVAIFLSSVAGHSEERKPLRNWSELVALAIQQPLDELEGPFGDYYRVLQRFEPDDREHDHLANYFSVVGGMQGGMFFPARVEIVSEDWLLTAEGHWFMKQWLYVLTLEGRIVRAGHYFLKKTKEGLVLDSGYIPTKPEQDQAQLKSILDAWYNSEIPRPGPRP